MIIDVRKYLFVGAKTDLADFFAMAQQKGFIEFIPSHGKRPVEPTSIIATLMSAVKVIRKLPRQKPYEKGGGIEYVLDIAKRILALKEAEGRLHEEIRMISGEIVRVAPLGDFSMDEIHTLEKQSGRVVQFFCMKASRRDALPECADMVYLSTEYDLDYFLAISPTPRHFPEMIEMRVEMPVGALKRKLRDRQKQLHATEEELKSLASHVSLLQRVLVEQLNDFHLDCAKKEVSSPMEVGVFTVEAWVPQNKIHSLFALLHGMAVYCEGILIEEGEKVPTYMENRGLARIGEDLVHIYDTPSSKDKDPSRWVLWSFALFFAVIIADAGYGILFLLIGLFLKWRLPRLEGVGKRFVHLTLLLASFCIGWGVLTTSYFGLEILPTNPLNRISLSNYLIEKKATYHLALKDDVYRSVIRSYPSAASASTPNAFLLSAVKQETGGDAFPVCDQFKESVAMEISLLIGVIHIGIALLRYVRRHWAGIGWIIFLIGGYLALPDQVNATSMFNYLGLVSKPLAKAIGSEMLWIGIVVALALALVQKRMQGISEVLQAISIFADVLSYLRLYALSLAATIMADTFNHLGAQVGLAYGVVIILLGQGMNILIGVMGGVIHGLRLNFIEWYHYCFEGGGRLFQPLHKLTQHTKE